MNTFLDLWMIVFMRSCRELWRLITDHFITPLQALLGRCSWRSWVVRNKKEEITLTSDSSFACAYEARVKAIVPVS